ncbi:beta/gamma crystallin-related protein [Streptomyces sp. NPDC085929]|uniref:beta/gamma crystallin-related protein n=1 Tax=Streptomyces sp. NPDC085929 TaxID=3365739 RepID=UPI0037CDA227
MISTGTPIESDDDISGKPRDTLYNGSVDSQTWPTCYVYDERGCTGERAPLDDKDIDNDYLKRIGFNDRISSISVAAGRRLTVFTEPNFQGKSQVLDPDPRGLNWRNYDLSADFNDTISSIRIEKVAQPR